MIGTAAVHAAPVAVVAAAAAAVVGASTTAVAGGSASVAGSAHSSLVVVVVAAAVPGRPASAPSTIPAAGILVAHTRRSTTSIGNDHWLPSMRICGSGIRRVLSRAGIVGIRRRRCRRRCRCDRLTIGVNMKYLRPCLLLRMVLVVMATTTLLRRWRGTGMVLDRGVPVPVGHCCRWRWWDMAVRLRGGGSGIDVDGLHLPIWALRVVHGLRLRRLCLRLRVLSRRRLMLLLGSNACLTVGYGRRRQMAVHLVLHMAVGRHRGSVLTQKHLGRGVVRAHSRKDRRGLVVDGGLLVLMRKLFVLLLLLLLLLLLVGILVLLLMLLAIPVRRWMILRVLGRPRRRGL